MRIWLGIWCYVSRCGVNCIAERNKLKTVGSYVKRSQKSITAKGLTPTGRDWLTRALDPYHDDVSVPRAGLPDYSPHATLIKEHNRSINVVAPTAVAEGETWNVAFVTTPNLCSANYRKVNAAGNGNVILSSTADAIFAAHTVSVITWPADGGSDWFLPGTDNSFVAGVEFGGISLYPGGNETTSHTLTRLIGGGFEVANTTSNLYKQGNMVAASCPQIIERDMIPALTDIATNETMGTPCFTARIPPTSIEAVRANPNAVSWPAEHGVYVPFRMDHAKNNYSIPIDIPLLYQGYQAGSGQALLSGVDMPTTGANNVRFPSVYQKPFISPIGTSIAMFTGLSSQTTLTLNVRFLEEVAPISDLDLLSYGPEVYPSDPLAMELYQRALMELPVAVTYAENASAEFWGKVVRTIQSIAAPIAGVAGGPMASAAVNAIGNTINSAINKKIAEARQKERAKGSSTKAANAQSQKIANQKKK